VVVVVDKCLLDFRFSLIGTYTKEKESERERHNSQKLNLTAERERERQCADTHKI
jgi:hypothetical protein